MSVCVCVVGLRVAIHFFHQPCTFEQSMSCDRLASVPFSYSWYVVRLRINDAERVEKGSKYRVVNEIDTILYLCQKNVYV